MCSANDKVPKWLSRLGFPTTMLCQEESCVNAAQQLLVLRSSNVTGSSFLTVEETCSYAVHPDNPEWCVYRQEAKITAHVHMSWLAEKIETHLFDNMVAQAGKVRNGGRL